MAEVLAAAGATVYVNNLEASRAAAVARVVGGRAVSLAIEGRLVAQLELTGTVKVSGAGLRARNCVFLFEQAGVLQRIEAYLDPTFGAQLGV